jgi:2-methylisocitrate lyase-like PEP mutase family enzyme
VSLDHKASRLRELHHAARPLVLANAWDAASAAAVEKAGFPAVATTSGGVAAALGFEDGHGTPAKEMLAAVGRIAAAVEVPVTADLERGYGLSAQELVAGMLEAGVVGLNFEDSDHDSSDASLIDAGEQAEAIAAIRSAASEAGVDIVINARVDCFLRKVDDPVDESLRRGRLYVEAGADCVFPIFAKEEAALERLVNEVGATVNALLVPDGPSPERLREIGVRRISTGSGLMIAAMRSLDRWLGRLQAGGPYWS